MVNIIIIKGIGFIILDILSGPVCLILNIYNIIID